MLTLLISLLCFVQGPNAAAAPQVEVAPEALVVRGPVELSVGEADAAVALLVGERARGILEERGRTLLAQAAPRWFPSFCRDQVLSRWLAGVDAEGAFRVLDRERVQHDHGSLGSSYRTALVVEADQQHVGAQLGRLRRQIPRAAEAFAVKCAGIVGFWVVLALALGWLDRLSRGYMTWRLRLLGLIAGSAAPAVLLFLV